MKATMKNDRHTVRWVFDEFGFIIPKNDDDPYQGCRVELTSLIVGQFPIYRLPNSGQVVVLRIPVVSIEP